jgi:hypothetical protein
LIEVTVMEVMKGSVLSFNPNASGFKAGGCGRPLGVTKRGFADSGWRPHPPGIISTVLPDWVNDLPAAPLLPF